MIYVDEVNPSAGKVFKDLVHLALFLCFFFPTESLKKDTEVHNVEIDYFQPRKQWNSLWKSNQQDHASSINFHSFISTLPIPQQLPTSIYLHSSLTVSPRTPFKDSSSLVNQL
ncbi:hypothetical protein Peur_002812 [Populus x canadensis]